MSRAVRPSVRGKVTEGLAFSDANGPLSGAEAAYEGKDGFAVWP